MKTMADLIAQLNCHAVARALKITGPVLSGGCVLASNDIGGIDVAAPAYYAVGGVLPDCIRPADQVPIPAAEFNPPVRTVEITDGEFLTVGPSASHPWKDVAEKIAIRAKPFLRPALEETLKAFRLPPPADPEPAKTESWRDRPPLL